MKKYACIFPGQGSQEVGMVDPFLSSSATSDIFTAANESAGFDLMKLVQNGPQEELTLTYNAQPAILATSIVAWKELLKAIGSKISPAYLAGHSLGEFSALTAAGALTIPDAIRLVRKRGQLMQDAVPKDVGAMAALIGGTDHDVKNLVDATSAGEILDIANLNAPGQTVISGQKSAVQRAMEKSGEYGIKRAIPLEVSAPFHSRLMKPVREKFSRELEDIDFNLPDWPVVHNVNAQPNMDNGLFHEMLSTQIESPVRWVESIEFMLDAGVEAFIEIGHGNVLQGLVKKIAGRDWDGVICGVSSPDDLEDVVKKIS
ncbi:MAG TPA: ACP S-malonyltransferase [bacterium]